MNWWQRLRRRNDLERGLDAELRDHIERHTAELIATGVAPAEARRLARLEFGGLDPIKEQCRDVRGLTLVEDAGRDITRALRGFRAQPVFTLVTVATLALGIGANAAIFMLLDGVVFKPLPLPKVDELVTFYENGPEGAADSLGGTGRFLRFSYPRFQRIEEALGSHGTLAAVTRSGRLAAQLPNVSARQYIRGQLVSGRFFDTLRISAARGRVLTTDDARVATQSPVAVISDGFWKRLLGRSNDVLGQTITINGVAATIVGVAPPGFVGMWSDAETDVWLPIALQRALRFENNSSSYGQIDPDRSWLEQDVVSWLNLVGRIPRDTRGAATASLQTANAQGLAALASGFKSESSRTSMLAHTLVVEPFARGFSGLRTRFSEALYILAGMVGLVLLVTCANIANLLLVRASGRARDMTIRLSLGATFGRLVRQDLTESLTLAVVGGGFGFLLGTWTSGFLARQVAGTTGQAPTVFRPDARVMAFSVALTLFTALIVGLIPAIRAARGGSLVANQRDAAGQATIPGMRPLVVAQLALSVVVVVAAILLARTLFNVARLDPGFSTHGVVSAAIDPIDSGYRADQMTPLSERLVAVLSAVPGVKSVAVSRCGLVAGCSSSGSINLEGTKESISVNQNWVSPRYFATVGIPLVSGREFEERDSSASARIAIITESIARQYFPNGDALGRRVSRSGALDTEIVGVVRDSRSQTLHDPPAAMVYFPVSQKPIATQTALTNVDVRVEGTEAPMIPAIRSALQRAEPQLLVSDVGTVATRLSRDLNREQIVSYVATGFAVLTLLLAALGLYGVLSYAVVRRTPEIGVRMALGAPRASVLALILRQGAALTTIGTLAGLAAAAAVMRSLQSLLFGVTPLDGATFVLAAAQFAVLAMLASYLPARRAARLDPLIALRSE